MFWDLAGKGIEDVVSFRWEEMSLYIEDLSKDGTKSVMRTHLADYFIWEAGNKKKLKAQKHSKDKP